MSWYLPFMMTEAGRRGITMRFGIAMAQAKRATKTKIFILF